MSIEAKIAEMTPEQVAQETELYRSKLDSVTVSYHHNAKLATLVKLWQDYEAGLEEEKTVTKKAELTIAEKRAKQQAEQLRLVRVKISCHNPAKAKIKSEMFTVGNSLVKVKKVIPLRGPAAESFHVPYILFRFLKNKKYVQRTSSMVDGRMVVSFAEVPEFVIEELPQLTEVELKELARRQALAKGQEV